MPVDTARYNSLISRAAFNMEAWRGTYQDLSANRLAMTAVGTPTWGVVNGLPCLKQGTVGDGATSATVQRIVDVTGSFTVEWLFSAQYVDGNDNFIIRQGTGGGGFGIYVATPGAGQFRAVLVIYDAAAAAARYVYYNPGLPLFWQYHMIYNPRTGGTSGATWINGTPVTTTLAGAGVSANIAVDRVVTVGVGAGGLKEFSIMRVFPFSLGNEDVTVLYEQAKILTGGEV